MRAERGFTLLEVMVALAVFATLAAAVMGASRHVLGQAAGLQERLVAAWVVDNQLAELTLERNLAPGRTEQTVEMGGYRWRLYQVLEHQPQTGLLTVELAARLSAEGRVVHRTRSALVPR